MKTRPKIVIIGAGGIIFPIRLTIDILSFPELQDSIISLMDIDASRLQRTAKMARLLIESHHLPAKLEVTTRRREALKNADFVLIAFQVGGLDAYKIDKDIPLKYGIDQCVGDTLNPGGIFRGLRSIPVYRQIALDMHELCPNALMLNYANPMAINCWAVNNLGIKVVGLCHSVQGTTRLLANQLGAKYEDIRFKCHGINHQAWITEFYENGKDVYPKLREVMFKRFPSPAHSRKSWRIAQGKGSQLAVDHGDYYDNEVVRTEIMRSFGYYHTESSHHASEYVPWFRKNPKMIKSYIDRRWDFYVHCINHDLEGQIRQVKEQCKKPLECSEEYGARIIHSIWTDKKRVIYGNVPNWGAPGSRLDSRAHLIPNLPQNCCVEVACLVDRNGVQPTAPGLLPPQCAALNRTNINVQELTVLAAESGDPTLAEQAIALDPLTGVHLTLPKIRSLTREMFKAQKRWLPQFKKI